MGAGIIAMAVAAVFEVDAFLSSTSRVGSFGEDEKPLVSRYPCVPPAFHVFYGSYCCESKHSESLL